MGGGGLMNINKDEFSLLYKVTPVWMNVIESLDPEDLPQHEGFRESSKYLEKLRCPNLASHETCVVGEFWGWTKDYITSDGINGCAMCSMFAFGIYHYHYSENKFLNKLREFQKHIEHVHQDML